MIVQRYGLIQENTNHNKTSHGRYRHGQSSLGGKQQKSPKKACVKSNLFRGTLMVFWRRYNSWNWKALRYFSFFLFLSASLCLSPSPISHSIGCYLHSFQNVVSTLVYMTFQVLHLWLNNYSVGAWIQLPVKETLECLPFIRCSSVGRGKGPMVPDVFNRTLGMDLGRDLDRAAISSDIFSFNCS